MCMKHNSKLILNSFLAVAVLSSCVGRQNIDYYSDEIYENYGVHGDGVIQPDNVKPYYPGDTNLAQRLGTDPSKPKEDYPNFFPLSAKKEISTPQQAMQMSPQQMMTPDQAMQVSPQQPSVLPFVLNNTDNKSQESISRPIDDKNINNAHYATYLKILADEYKIYSDIMAQGGYASNAQLLKSKSDTATSGNDVMFETEYSFELPLDKRSIVVQHRKILENAKSNINILHKNPDLMAKLQASYDCMVLEAKDRMYSQKTQCGMHFFTTLDSLEKIYGDLKTVKPVVNTTVNDSNVNVLPVKNMTTIIVPINIAGWDQKQHSQSQKESHFVARTNEFEDRAILKYDNHKSFVVYYNVGSSNLDSTAIYVINKAIAFAQDYDTYKIKILGFSDRIGDRDFNKKLSEIRANNVKNALIERGIAKDKIDKVIFGEDYNSVDTRDGVGESFNRRVVIEVNTNTEFDEDAFIFKKASEDEII